ncbi:sulfite oxidase isoform X2 [Oratosquilla oratoria]
MFPRAIWNKRCLLQSASKLRILTSSASTAHDKQYSGDDGSGNWSFVHGKKPGVAWIVGVLGIGTGSALWLRNEYSADAASLQDSSDFEVDAYGNWVQGLPEYSLDDVAKHNDMEAGVWVAFKEGVYDITSFIKKHPGGDKIMMGAGGSVEPFWALYSVHKHKFVLDLLEKYRIGNLSKKDVGVSIKDLDDPYASEPYRHISLKPSSKKPFNAEPPLPLLVDNLITPNELFYVRNHLPVPVIDPAEYELEISGIEVEEKALTLEDIKKFPKYTVTATIQCAGNRRSEMVKVKPVKGLSWGQAAIGNATWSGARLYDVLKAAGLDEDKTEAVHVQFEGLDTDPGNMPYGASIPIEKAMDPRGDVILAYEMNGEEIPRDHGYPIRVIVPGVVGARNVKWLGRIEVSKDESDAHWQQNDYKGFAPSVDWDTVDFKKSPAIQELPVISGICDPVEGEKIKVNEEGKVKVRGYAWSGGGRKIIRVDVSADGGKTWQAADELKSDEAKHPRAWGWSIFTAYVPVSKDAKEIQLCAKAVDSQYNVQPENFDNIWNLRGVLANAYHRVNVKL